MSDKVVGLDAKRKKRFTDFADEPKLLDGDKISIERILNKEIEIIDYKISPSKYTKNKSGKCLTLQFIGEDGQRHILFTGSDVLIGQMERYGDELPFIATIRKVDRYYTLS